jgi:hypothetical protein
MFYPLILTSYASCAAYFIAFHKMQKKIPQINESILKNYKEVCEKDDKKYCPIGYLFADQFDFWSYMIYNKLKYSVSAGHVISWLQKDGDKTYVCRSLVRPDGKILCDVDKSEYSYDTSDENVAKVETGYLIGTSYGDKYYFPGKGNYPKSVIEF